jgi:hypothetical protein
MDEALIPVSKPEALVEIGPADSAGLLHRLL